MFDVNKTIEALKRWIIDWFDENGPAVMPLSVSREVKTALPSQLFVLLHLVRTA